MPGRPQLGMEQTSFRNACGLDTEGHLSTARDVAVMSREILTHCPEVLHYSGIWTDTLRNGQTQLVNTNKLLKRYEGITGLKTGTTSGAGVCISASATRDGLPSSPLSWGHPAAPTASTPPRRFWTTASGPMRPRRCQNSRHSRCSSRSGKRGGQRPAGLLALRDGAGGEGDSGASLYTELTLPQELEAPVEQGDRRWAKPRLSGGSLLEEYEVLAATDAPRMTVRDAIACCGRASPACPDRKRTQDRPKAVCSAQQNALSACTKDVRAYKTTLLKLYEKRGFWP